MPRDPTCERCSLHAIAAHRCIPGRGWLGNGFSVTDTYRLMIVGENPGPREDEADAVFVGDSGDLLGETLEAVGIGHAFLTNATRCYKGLQTIKAAHLKACAPYLDEEIAAQRPTHILALGAAALHRLVGLGKITELAGKISWSDRYQCYVMPALHPAAILRDMGKKNAWRSDLLQLARHMRGEMLTEIPANVMAPAGDDGVLQLAQMIQLGQVPLVAIDFESIPSVPDWPKTDVVPWWHRDFKAYSVAFGDPGHAVVLPLDHPQHVAGGHRAVSLEARRIFFGALREQFSKPGGATLRTGHNFLYDAPVWYRVCFDLGIPYVPYFDFDSMLAAWLEDENAPKRLKWRGQTALGWPNWDVDASKEHDLTELMTYNGYDACATAALTHVDATWLHERPKLERYFDQLVIPTANALVRMMIRGVYLDQATLEERRAVCRDYRAEAAALVPVTNPGSPQQVARWLYDDLKLPVLKLTAGGAPSTDEDTIKRLALTHPDVRAILPYRKWAKYEDTYFKDFQRRLDLSIDGRAHWDYRYGNVETGRVSSRFHTIPRDPFVKGVITAPPGRVLITADYSQQEARIVAWEAAGRPASWDAVTEADAPMLYAFKNGVDIYKLQAAAALRKRPEEVTTGPDSERQNMGKVPTLAFLYGMREDTFIQQAWEDYDLVFTKAEAKHLRDTFFNLWPEIARWHRREERLIRARGYVQTCLGRIRHLPAAQGAGKEALEAIRSGINCYGQGPASDITQKALCIVDDQLEPYHEAFVVADVHDALYVEADEEEAPRVASTVAACMLAAPRYLEALGLHLPPGLLKVEVTLGPDGEGVPLDKWLALREASARSPRLAAETAAR